MWGCGWGGWLRAAVVRLLLLPRALLHCCLIHAVEGTASLLLNVCCRFPHCGGLLVLSIPPCHCVQVEREREQMEQGEAVPVAVAEPAKRAKHNVVGVGRSSGRGDWKQVSGLSGTCGSCVVVASHSRRCHGSRLHRPCAPSRAIPRPQYVPSHPSLSHAVLSPPALCPPAAAGGARGQPAQSQAVHQLGQEDEGQGGGAGVQGRQTRGSHGAQGDGGRGEAAAGGGQGQGWGLACRRWRDSCWVGFNQQATRAAAWVPHADWLRCCIARLQTPLPLNPPRRLTRTHRRRRRRQSGRRQR